MTARDADRRARSRLPLSRFPQTKPKIAEPSRDRLLANEELRRANRELEQFAYIASHDLREPLRMINIYTQLLIERHGKEFDMLGRQFAQHVQENPARMEQLIRDVLEYFGLFNRLHGREVPGTGLGLAICRRIVEQQGGTISAESNPNQGATFIFTLKGWNRYGSRYASSPKNSAGGGQCR